MRRCFDLIASAAADEKSPVPLSRKCKRERERKRDSGGCSGGWGVLVGENGGLLLLPLAA